MNITEIFQKLVFFTLTLLIICVQKTNAQEAVVFNEEIDWQWVRPQTYGGNSFYWWHWKEGSSHNVINWGDMSPTDWTTPYDYENGTFYIRYVILSQPTHSAFSIQLGIWQDVNSQKECVSPLLYFGTGGAGQENQRSLGSPSDWTSVFHNTTGDVDFTRPENFYRIGIVLWKGSGSCIPLETSTVTDVDCPDAQTEQANFFPMQAAVTVVAVAPGHTFSGWDNYPVPGGGSTKPPAPTYGIDYPNEQTNKVIATTDEYSYNSNMSGAVTGNGSKLSLTPGTDVYFRVKADGEIPASNIQTLDVPSRPAAPTFGYDATNQRTSTTVSSSYEYSSNSNMSGAVDGTGTYVSIPLGSTKYFRKKATSSAFKSAIQTLTGTSTPSNGQSEFVILNDVIDFPNTTDTNGFYFFYHNSTMPTNWQTPYDFYNGQIYSRFEIISQATSTPIILQFGIWQKLPPETGTLYETMGPLSYMNGPGSVYTRNNSPSTWWKLNGQNIDWTQMDKVWHFGINPWKDESLQIRQENPSVWAERYTYWFPMRVRAIVVAVASGYTFSGWNNYLTAGGVPTYAIDYAAETTTANVSSSDEYSYNQTTWVSGSNGKLALVPGQDVYFRKKISPTQVQTLDVPSRESTPAFAIDYENETTTTAVSSSYEYSLNANMTSAGTGANQALPLTPGTTLYIRKKSTASSFASEKQQLVIPARPETPQITLNFSTEYTSSIPSDVSYSTGSNMESPLAGTGEAIKVTPGTNLYFMKPAGNGSFKSGIQTLVVPARPATPGITIDYAYESTQQVLNSSYIISGNADMSGSFSGTGSKLNIMPGTHLYFRTKSTSSSFASDIQALNVPSRPELVLGVTSPTSLTSVPVNVHFDYPVTGFSQEDLSVANGTIDSVSADLVAYIKPTAEGQVRVSMPANIVQPGNFAAYTLAFSYQIATGTESYNENSLRIYPSIVNDYLYVDFSGDIRNTPYEIYASNGAKILNGLIGGTHYPINVSSLSKGLYLFRIVNDKLSERTYRFIKE